MAEATHRALTGLDRSEVMIIRLRVSTMVFIAIEGGWEETLALLVDITKLVTADSEERRGRNFSD